MAKSLLKRKGASISVLISPTKTVLNQTMYEAWMGKNPRVSHLKFFGRIKYALVNFCYKLDEKSKKSIFIGYST